MIQIKEDFVRLYKQRMNYVCATLVKNGIEESNVNLELARRMYNHNWYYNYTNNYKAWAAGYTSFLEIEQWKDSNKTMDYEHIWELFCPWSKYNAFKKPGETN